jgi:hypothetical protein
MDRPRIVLHYPINSTEINLHQWLSLNDESLHPNLRTLW